MVVEVVVAAAAVQPGSDAEVTRTDSAARARVCCCCCYYCCRRHHRRRRRRPPQCFRSICFGSRVRRSRVNAYNLKTLLSKSPPHPGHVSCDRCFLYTIRKLLSSFILITITFDYFRRRRRSLSLTHRPNSFRPSLPAGNVE